MPIWAGDNKRLCAIEPCFTSFATVFQSYLDDGQVIMKGCVQWNPFYDSKDLHLRCGLNLGPLDQ